MVYYGSLPWVRPGTLCYFHWGLPDMLLAWVFRYPHKMNDLMNITAGCESLMRGHLSQRDGSKFRLIVCSVNLGETACADVQSVFRSSITNMPPHLRTNVQSMFKSSMSTKQGPSPRRKSIKGVGSSRLVLLSGHHPTSSQHSQTTKQPSFFLQHHTLLCLYTYPLGNNTAPKSKFYLTTYAPRKNKSPPVATPDRCKMSAAGASTSQQTQSEDKKQYNVCFDWTRDGVYQLRTTRRNRCISTTQGEVYGPTFKKSDETRAVYVRLDVVENCEDRPPTQACVKICTIDEDQLAKFRAAILPFKWNTAEICRGQDDKSPGNFMRLAWTEAWRQGAFPKPKYDIGMEIFRQCSQTDEGWPAEEWNRVCRLVKEHGGVYYPGSGEAPRRYLNKERVRWDPVSKKITRYYHPR